MSVKILKRFLMIFATLAISGCTKEVQYIDRPYEVKVPVKCIVPETKCYPNQPTYTEEIKEMRLCIERYKEAAEVCR